MSVLTELQDAVAAVATAVGPSVVGIGSRQRGSGVVVAEGRVLTNAHNLRGAEVTVRFAGGRTDRRRRQGRRLGRRPRRDRGRHRRRAAARVGVGRGHHRHRRVRRRRHPVRRGPRVVRLRVVRRARVPRPRRPADLGLARAHRAARARLVGQPARRHRRRARRAQHQPRRRGLLPRAAGRRDAQGARRRAGPRRVARSARPWASPSPRPTSPAGCAARSGSPSATASWSAASSPGRPADAAGIAEGDLLVAAGGRPIDDVDALHEALRDAGCRSS